MTGLEAIQHHLGGEFVDEEMRKADNFLGHVAWIMSWTKKRREIWYECCGKTLVESDHNNNSADEKYALRNAAHRKTGACQYCCSHVRYLNRRWVRREDYTQVYTVWYRMSKAEPNTLLVLGMWAGRRWYLAKEGAKPQDIKTEYEPCSMVILPWNGKPERYIREVLRGPGSYDSWWWGCRADPNSGGWVKRDRVEGGDRQGIRATGVKYLVCGDLVETTRGTRWGKAAAFAKQVRGVPYTADRVQPLKVFCTHPAMEYMLGNGMEGLIESCCREDGTVSMIRWRRKNPKDMLQLDGNELARLRRMSPEKVSGTGLMILRTARKLGQRVKLEDAMEMAASPKLDCRSMKWLRAILEQYGPRWGVMRILRYCSKEYGQLGLWKDYMCELAELGEEMDEARVFPRDLHAAHAQTSARIRYKEDGITAEKVAERARKLDKLAFEACGLVMAPFESPEEIIREGSAQSICIGRYITQYANGKTVLLKLRRAEAPDVPFHAVEMSTDGKWVIQCRGAHNKTYPEDEKDVRAFWAAWDAAHQTHNNIWLTINRRERIA